MGYDVALWGSLKFPKGGVSAWRALEVDGRRWSDWTMWFENAERSAPRTVDEHLAEWRSFGEGSELFSVEIGPSKVDVRAFFRQDVLVEKAQSIAALFRVAERAGATGELTFAGVGAPLAYRLTLSKKGSTFEALDEDLEDSPEVEEVLLAAKEREEAGKKAGREKKKKAASAKPAPKAQKGEAKASSGEEAARKLLLSDASIPDRADAAESLAGCESDASIDALFKALHEPGVTQGGKKYGPYLNPLRRAVEHALSSSKRDDVGARVLSLLTPAALQIKAGPTGDFVQATFKEQDKEDFVRALLYILGYAKYRPARARLTEIFRTHHLTEIRERAAEALLFSASPEEIRGAFGEDPKAFFAEHVNIGVFDRLLVVSMAEKLLEYVGKQSR